MDCLVAIAEYDVACELKLKGCLALVHFMQRQDKCSSLQSSKRRTGPDRRAVTMLKARRKVLEIQDDIVRNTCNTMLDKIECRSVSCCDEFEEVFNLIDVFVK